MEKRLLSSRGMLKNFLLVSLGILVFTATNTLAQDTNKNRHSLADFVKEELRKNQMRIQQERDAKQQDLNERIRSLGPGMPNKVPNDTKNTHNISYLQVVQEKINSQWIVPTIDVGREIAVVVKFRLHRSGTVNDVVVEKTSGNSIFDRAGTRAVLDAAPLPPFPPLMSEQYLDTQFTFNVKH